jgi:hypothetical protein
VAQDFAMTLISPNRQNPNRLSQWRSQPRSRPRFSECLKEADWSHTIDVERNFILLMSTNDLCSFRVMILVKECVEQVVVIISIERRYPPPYLPSANGLAESSQWIKPRCDICFTRATLRRMHMRFVRFVLDAREMLAFIPIFSIGARSRRFKH